MPCCIYICIYICYCLVLVKRIFHSFPCFLFFLFASCLQKLLLYGYVYIVQLDMYNENTLLHSFYYDDYVNVYKVEYKINFQSIQTMFTTMATFWNKYIARKRLKKWNCANMLCLLINFILILINYFWHIVNNSHLL